MITQKCLEIFVSQGHDKNTEYYNYISNSYTHFTVIVPFNLEDTLHKFRLQNSWMSRYTLDLILQCKYKQIRCCCWPCKLD